MRKPAATSGRTAPMTLSWMVGPRGPDCRENRRGSPAVPAPRRDRPRAAEAGWRARLRRIWRSRPCLASSRSTPRETHAHSICWNVATDRDPDNALATALAAWARAQRIVYHFSATPVEERARAPTWRGRRGPSPTTRRYSPFLAMPSPRFTTSMPRALSSARRCRWMPGRRGPGVAAVGSTCTRATSESADRAVQASRLTWHRTILWHSTVWCGIGCAHFNAGRYSDAATLARARARRDILGDMDPSDPMPRLRSWRRRDRGPSQPCQLQDHYPRAHGLLVQQGLPPLPHAFRHRVVEALHTVGLPRLMFRNSHVRCPPSHAIAGEAKQSPVHPCNIPRIIAWLAMAGAAATSRSLLAPSRPETVVIYLTPSRPGRG